MKIIKILFIPRSSVHLRLPLFSSPCCAKSSQSSRRVFLSHISLSNDNFENVNAIKKLMFFLLIHQRNQYTKKCIGYSQQTSNFKLNGITIPRYLKIDIPVILQQCYYCYNTYYVSSLFFDSLIAFYAEMDAKACLFGKV